MNEETKEILKNLGLEKLEIITKEGVDALFIALELIVKDTENKFDDMIIPALPLLKAKLLELVDKIHE
jgi:hypothetical protein